MYLFFDFDGTLVDSMPVWAGVHINMLKEYGIAVPDGFINTITPLGNNGAALHTISLGVPLTAEEYADRAHEHLLYEYGRRIVLKEGVREALDVFKAQGHSLNVLTASPHRYLDPCLIRNGVYDIFDNVWSIDDFGLTKDNVQIYREAAERLGAETSECVFFDDNITAVKTAALSGMRAVGVYDATSEALKEEIKSSCNLYIHRFSELFK